MTSPYQDQPVERWEAITGEVIARHPLSTDLLRDSVFAAWREIFNSRVGSLQIGRDIHPQPQIVGFFLHELIPHEIARRAEGWRCGRGAEKDVHFEANSEFSLELKTSSHPRHIFGNRSYAQRPGARSREKAGYYLAVNFPKLGGTETAGLRITRIRFGWLDHEDWVGQRAATGQQAHLRPEADRYKLTDILTQP